MNVHPTSVLNPNHYVDDGIFEIEQSKIFGKLWIFACLKSSIGADRCFATRRIGGRSILLRNSGGRIRAFENACPHRSMPLEVDSFGQSKSICPYHGWVFNDDGSVKSIPKEQDLYAFPIEIRETLCLREFSVEVIGQFVFVNVHNNPIPIDMQFSQAVISRLEDISEYFGEVSVHAEIPVSYNWKLNFENVLDHEHVPYVHPKTFLPLMRQAGEDGIKSGAFDEFPSSASLIDQSWFSSSPLNVQSWPWHASVRRYGPSNTYHNHFLFPNVNFISVGGYVFLIQQFEPGSSGKTIVRFTLTTARAAKRIPALPAILRGHMKGEIDVLMEDVRLLERLQANLSRGLGAVRHGRYEHRLANFGRAYLDLLHERQQ